MTESGGYSFASQPDDGTLIGLNGRRLHRIARDGTILADFSTPVSGEQNGNGVVFEGPFDPAISPDGTKVAYSYLSTTVWTDPGCTPPNCDYKRTEVRRGVATVALRCPRGCGGELSLRHMGRADFSLLRGEEEVRSA